MKRWYVYLGGGRSTEPTPEYQVVGYVENSCFSNSSGLYPGALEVAQNVFGRNAEVVDGGDVAFPRRCPTNFVRLGECKRIFVASGLTH